MIPRQVEGTIPAQDEALFHVILISSLYPEPSSGGELVLFRHLREFAPFTHEVHSNKPSPGKGRFAPARLLRGAARRALGRWFDDWLVWRGARGLARRLPVTVDRSRATVVLTVAHEDGFVAAMTYSRKLNLPLVSLFHDWWPDAAQVHRFALPALNAAFAQLHASSTVSLCVSESMKSHLGPHPCARLLYPIPARTVVRRSPPAAGDRSKLVYAGNLFEYGPMVGGLIDAFETRKTLRFEVRGPNPNWSYAFQKKAAASGAFLGVAPRSDFDRWLLTADFFLIPMVFEAAMRRRMETSFPSKLTEYAQFGKPLVIWGPSYCSAIKWAKEGARALCVEDPNPNALIEAVERLRSSAAECERLSAEARRAAATDFSPELLQGHFISALQFAIESHRRHERR